MGDPKKRILIFEDHIAIQSILTFVLKKKGYDIRIEVDGSEAVASALEYAPDLILMDYIMPGKDGVEAIADLRRAGVAVPIIMLTSKDFPADKARARDAGATAYLIKPFDPKTLEAEIAPYLSES